MLFGSRAKGTHCNRFDGDLAFSGNLEAFGAGVIAAQSEQLTPLVAHIERVGD